eukprot:12172537-Karenia_brevis.AAC.1
MEDTALIDQVLEVSKERLKLNASAMVRMYPQQPMMLIYTADGTPMRVKLAHAQQVKHDALGETRTVQRSGFQRREYLCQRQFLKCFDDQGKPQVC